MMLVLPLLVLCRAPLADPTEPVATTVATETVEDDPPGAPAKSTLVTPPPSHEDPDHRRLEGGFGVRFGSQLIDGRDVGTVTPIHVDAGMRLPNWLLYGEYDLMSFTWPTTPVALSGAAPVGGEATGLMQRVAGNARYAIGHVGEKDMDSNVWAEAGVGLQHVTWDAGGVWTRPDLSLGIGGSMFGLGDTKHGGMSAGFRVTLARRNNASGPPICAGPCDMATAPSGWDRSITFDLTMLFGN